MIRTVLFIFPLCFCSMGWSADDIAPTQKLIKAYEQATKNSTDSFVAATVLSMHATLNKEKINSTKLSANNLKTIDIAVKELASITALAKELESKLSAADVAKITGENPWSIFRGAKKFHFTNTQGECTPQKYEEVKKQIDLAELNSRAPYIGAYVTTVEAPFQKNYLRTLSALVAKDPRFKNYQRLNDTMLNEKAVTQIGEKSGLTAFVAAFSGTDKVRLKRYEDSLVKEGVPRSEVSAYAGKLALLSPECLGSINIHFLKSIRRDFTIAKIAKFAQQLRGVSLTSEDIPDGLKRFVNEKDPYLRSARDSWSAVIEISKVGVDKVVLISPGEDQHAPADDIRSEPITVHLK